MPNFKTRAFEDNDTAMVFDAWMLFAKGTPGFVNVPARILFPKYRSIVQNTLKQNKTTMAVNPEDDTHVFGFVSFREIETIPIISFAYIKEPFRGLGIEEELLNQAVGETTFLTHPIFWIKTYFPKTSFIYNPFLDWNL